jgi:Zn-dependent peptidase ImmA (M78 family)
MRVPVPRRSDPEIWAAVEEFRRRGNIRPFTTVPADVFSIMEIALKLDPIPFPSLYDKFKADAAISFDLTGIYLDQKAYEDFQNGDRWEERRLRYSVAHELGHYVLHETEIRASFFESVADFKKWAGRRDDCDSAEYQAHEFAGCLLVPRATLVRVYDECCAAQDRQDKKWRERPAARSTLAKMIAPRFGVNRQVIEVRFHRDGLWPAE